jgi:hypothetical protein
VLLSLNISAIIHCFEDSDEQKQAVQEGTYREVQPAQKLPIQFLEIERFFSQGLISACQRKITIVTEQYQVRQNLPT